MRRLTAFRVGGSRFALPAEFVEECVEVGPLEHRLPRSGGGGTALACVRGRWLPVLELGEAVEGIDAPPGGGQSSLLLVVGRGRARLGIRVDGVDGVIEVEDRVADLARREELIEVQGELVRCIDPERVVASRASDLWREGGSMEEARTEAEPLQVVAFRVGGEEFGVDVMKVKRVLKLPELRSVPEVPDFVEGVVSAEDAVVPVIDLRKRFSVPVAEFASAPTLLIVDSARDVVGLVVDDVPGVVAVPAGAVSPAPEFFKGLAGRYLDGVAEDSDRLIILLNLDEILSSKERIALDRVRERASSRRGKGARGRGSKGKKRRARRKKGDD